MLRKTLIFLAIIYLTGCAAYKELKPKPEIEPQINGYIELQRSGKNFELKPGKRYFISFPAPAGNEAFLVITAKESGQFRAELATDFDKKKKGVLTAVERENFNAPEIFAYPLEQNVQNFYWVIEEVHSKIKIDLTYRYTEQWRFRYEMGAAGVRSILEENRTDHGAIEAFAAQARQVRPADYLQSANHKNDQLLAAQKTLQNYEKLFPAFVLYSSDPAYQDYKALSAVLEDELDFLNRYLYVLENFEALEETSGKPALFMERLAQYQSFVDKTGQAPLAAIDAFKERLEVHLDEFNEYMDRRIAGTSGGTVGVNSTDALALYESLGRTVPTDFTEKAGFIKEYDLRFRKYEQVKEQFSDLRNAVENSTEWPSDGYFDQKRSQAARLRGDLPSAGFSAFGKYNSSSLVSGFKKDVDQLRSAINQTETDYQQAERIVPQINAARANNNFGEMIRIIRNYSNLEFLTKIYASLDQRSLQNQENQIVSALEGGQFAAAETRLRDLHSDRSFIDYNTVLKRKNELVGGLEDKLYSRVEVQSREQARQHMTEHQAEVNNVEAVYDSPKFDPVFVPQFSSGLSGNNTGRGARLAAELKNLKENEYPALSIKTLYDRFLAAKGSEAIHTARAVVKHGTYYKGNELTIKQRVGECDPWASKWISKAKEYRKIFALPVTEQPGIENEYVLRFNIKIASDAQFPTWDVYLKLPDELAKEAASKQWYTKMTLNKQELKNEGRFRITSPSAANNFQVEIGPVSTLKSGDNVLEIHFNHKTWQVFELSAMAQRPLLKKN